MYSMFQTLSHQNEPNLTLYVYVQKYTSCSGKLVETKKLFIALRLIGFEYFKSHPTKNIKKLLIPLKKQNT